MTRVVKGPKPNRSHLCGATVLSGVQRGLRLRMLEFDVEDSGAV